MRYNLYGKQLKNGPWGTLLIEDKRATTELIDGDELLTTFEVEHYLDACILSNRFLGLNPYRPADQDIPEYLNALDRLGISKEEIRIEREQHEVEPLPYLED